jgi:predicted nucleic acid-binding protein
MMTQDVKRLLVDTNVLVYSSDDLSPLQNLAQQALQKARGLGIDLVISQQILREYLVITTRFSMSKTNASLFQKILGNVKMFQAELTVLAETPAILPRLLALLDEIPTSGKQIHDANIAATMLVHGITHILTGNVEDFQRFSGKIHIVPLMEWIK